MSAPQKSIITEGHRKEKAEAYRFLERLDEDTRFTFQTFDDRDNNNRQLVRVLHGSLEDNFQKLERLNERGAGIFVTVNRTDLTGRKAENIIETRAVFADLDGAPLAPVLDFELKPHIVVQSSPERWHAYWLCRGIPLEKFNKTQKNIAHRFGADPSIVDLPRVMRVPGFHHLKKEPFLVQIKQLDDSEPYEVSEIRHCFGNTGDHSNSTTDPARAFAPMPRLGLAPAGNMQNIADALGFIDPQVYGDWIAVGHALKTGGEQYLETFQKWSKTRPDGSIPHNFISENDVQRVWESFRPNRTSLAKVFRKAADAGWTGSSPFTLQTNSHTEIARGVLAETALWGPEPVYADGELWRYQDTHWQKVEGFEQRKWIQDLDGISYGQKGVLHANKSLIDGVLTELHAMCAVPDFFDNSPIGINCDSGFIRLRRSHKPELMPHSADLRQRFCVSAEWHPGASVLPSCLTERFFSGIWSGRGTAIEGRRLLEEILGVTLAGLSTELKSPKAFVLHGSSAANGKSQFIQLLQGILPSSAHSAISPSDMGKEQFLADLVGKTANLANELSSVKVISSDKMKAVISGDIVSAKRVYQPVFQFAPRALHVFTANVLPSFQGGLDEGIRRRFVVVPFTESIPESKRVPEIAKRILEHEKEAILSLAVVGAARILVSGVYSISKAMEQATEEWFHDADNLMGWIDEGGIENLLRRGKYASFDDAYKSYREVVEARGPGEWLSRYSVFKRIVREYVKNDPQLDIVRHSEGYRIVEKMLV